jgi:hypothetical protein
MAAMTRTETLTIVRLNRATLARQMLLAREDISPVAAVERLCGMQAQEPRPPFIGLWTRLARFAPGDLHRALDEREIVRGTLMRGTLHLMSADDYAAHRMTLQPMLSRIAAGILRERANGLDVEALVPVARALLAAEPRTFNQLRPLLRDAFPRIDERALGYLARTELPLAMIPTDDRWGFPADSRFGLAEDWIGRPLFNDGGPAALFLRYLAAFGPASVADFQQWSGFQSMRSTVETLRPTLAVFADERGRELFDLPDAPRPDPATPAPVRFLPEFDNLLLSHADRTRVLPDEHRRQVLGAKNGRIPGTFLIDGFVAGTWRIERKRGVATLTFSPFAPLAKPVLAEVEREGEALLRFVEDDASTFDIRQCSPVGAA